MNIYAKVPTQKTYVSVPKPTRIRSVLKASAVSSQTTTFGQHSLSLVRIHRRQNDLSASKRQVECNAAAAAAGAPEEAEQSGGLVKTLKLGVLFGLWYAFNIYFNIDNKQVLKVYHYPVTMTLIQFGVGAVLSLLFLMVGLVKRTKITQGTVVSCSPLAVAHTLGNLLTNTSLGLVAVSFTHTIKALEPFFSVLLSFMFLGDAPHPLVLLTLLPIVGGVAAASFSEASFNWAGFASAMGSNLSFQSRNVLSKKVMTSDLKALDNKQLFSLITVLAFLIVLPVCLLKEGFTFYPAAMSALGIADPNTVIMKALRAGFFFHMYQQVSYMILEQVSPVTHSIGNCVKRVIVIVASVVVFQNPVSQQNAIGTGVALFGVLLYSQAKRLTGKKKSA
eukprot:TRINITY_DN7706_c0_g1_i1.p1 TRINITY_DN7706_c0_g1~~TRINITY_DN7706_c0_g1_i1.p1  ORF type:complete len:406 (-),score=54.68 TRINITY_DN7706_c0_g1_i1:206-1378(-)